MKTRNLLILLGIASVVILIVFNAAKDTVYKILGVETDTAKLERLKINNKQQKEALIQKEKEKKILILKSSTELNTTIENKTLSNNLEKEIVKLKTDIKPETNKTKILKQIKKEIKINVPLPTNNKTKQVKNQNKHLTTHKGKHKATEQDTSTTIEKDNDSNIITIRKSDYLIYGYRSIKAYYKAYESVMSIDNNKSTGKDKK